VPENDIIFGHTRSILTVYVRII